MATTSEASRLQSAGYVMRFIGITVGLLAMFGFSGCGVGGPDDLAGQQAAYGQQQQQPAAASQGQALIGLDGTPVGDDGEPQGPAGNGPVDPSIANLPTDPVPWQAPSTNDHVDPFDNPFEPPVAPPNGMPSSK